MRLQRKTEIEGRVIMTSQMSALILLARKRSSLMEKLVSEEASYESEAAKEDRGYGYALELPYSKQNSNFKSRITRIGRDLIILGLVVCLLRTGYVSQWMSRNMIQTNEVTVSHA
jgi:hypothetical protein